MIAPGYARSDGECGVPSAEAILVTLKRGGELRGHCLHADEPVADFQVIYWQEGNGRTRRRQTFSDRTDGSFELDDLPADRKLRVVVDADHGRESPFREVTLVAGETRRLDWRIEEPVPVRGRVLRPDGSPSPDAIVRLRRCTTDRLAAVPVAVEDDGTFEVGPARAGEWILGASERKSGLVANRTLNLEPEQAPPFVVLTLGRLVVLRGRLSDEDGGRPAAPVGVTFEPDDHSFQPRSTRMGIDGTFEIEDLPPGPGQLRLEAAGTYMTEMRRLPEIPGDGIEVRLRRRSPGCTVRVDIVERGTGEECDGAKVFAIPRDSVAPATEFTTQRFMRVPGLIAFLPAPAWLTAGTWDFVAIADDERIGFASVDLREAEERELQIAVAPGAWITVHGMSPRERADAVQLLRARVGVTIVFQQEVKSGDFTDLLVPAGDIVLELLQDGPVVAAAERRFSPGETAEIELRPKE